MSGPTHVALCRRSGDWWAIEVPAVDGVLAQARRLAQAEAMARDAIAMMLNVMPDSVAVEAVPQLPERVERAVVQVRTSRSQVERVPPNACGWRATRCCRRWTWRR